ncbi:MAG: HD-GYP domain-containing protein, partial [Oscillospiraceae bacterium]
KFSEKLLIEYQKDANKRLAVVCRIGMGILVTAMLLNLMHVFIIDDIIYPILTFSIVVLFIPTIMYDILQKDSKPVRYFVVTLVVLMSGLLYAFLSYHVIIMLVFPVVLTLIYCDRKLLWYTTLLGIPVMVISHLVAFYIKCVPDEPLVTLKGVLLYGVLPRTLEYFAVAAVCLSIAHKINDLIKELERKNDELYTEQQNIITSLATMIEAESKETGWHVKRVSEYTAILCRAVGMEDEEVWKVSLAAMMHDVGKILIPREIIEKPGRLTNEEFEIVKRHTIYGKRMLEDAQGEIMKISATIAYEHHERFDGTGYAGITGKDIHLYSRCVSIADVFDALVSWRPYKKPWTLDEARQEIIRQSGKQFDPDLVKLFDEHFDEFKQVFERYPDSTKSIETDEMFK